MHKALLSISSLLLCFSLQAQQRPENPLILDQYTADPSAHVFHDTLWVYPSHDKSDAASFNMEDYHVFSTTDMVHWQDHGVIFNPLRDTSWAKQEAWAPDCIERNGKFYLYYPTDKKHIGVAVSDRPDGPFVDPLGHPLISIDSPGVVCDRDFIDPCCFIDDDGQAYLYMGQNTPCCIKLNDDMISYDGKVHLLQGVHEFFEAAWMHKYNGKYYFSYSDGPFFGHEPQISYCVGDSPLGPFEYKGVILGPVNSGTNHHSIVEYNGQWWMFYHNADLSLYNDPSRNGHTGVRRSICCDPLYYNADGTIQPLIPTHSQARISSNTAGPRLTFAHPWQGKRVAYFGDSITDPRNNGSKKKYWHYLQEWLGITPFVYAISGRQWNDIPRQTDDLQKQVGDSIDAILIFIGTNDYNDGVPVGQWYEEKDEEVMYGHHEQKKMTPRKRQYLCMDNTTYKGRINIALSKIKQTYPDKQVILLTPIHRAQFHASDTNWQCTEDYTNQIGIYLKEYVDAVKEAGYVWSVPVIDMNALSGLYPMTDEHGKFFHDPAVDRLHPNDLGHERMAKTLLYQLMTLPIF